MSGGERGIDDGSQPLPVPFEEMEAERGEKHLPVPRSNFWRWFRKRACRRLPESLVRGWMAPDSPGADDVAVSVYFVPFDLAQGRH